MGCWSETCQISGLPIVDGARMVTFILEKNPHAEHEGGNVTYPVDLWNLKSYAIRGRYNDYGVPEDIDDSILNNELLHKYGYDDIENFIRYIERGNVENTSVFYILEDIYDNIISMDGLTAKFQEDYYRQKNIFSYQEKKLYELLRYLRNYKLEHIIAVITDAEFCVKYKVTDAEKLEELNRNFEEIHKMLPKFLEATYRNSESINFPCLDFYEPNNYYDTLSDDDKYVFLEETLKGVFELYMLQRFMIMTRNAFGPRSGKGCQNSDFDMFIEMYDFFKNVAQKEQRKFEEE